MRLIIIHFVELIRRFFHLSDGGQVFACFGNGISSLGKEANYG
ncbi:hypothetical protein DDI_2052 [Dickeya dianthicola RNS04.9]|nr:hypothetical protein DDI_2052 [Dickeya dianthicola RNS04.9]